MARDYAAVPYAYWEEMSDLSDAEFGRLIRALLRYSETGETIALRGNERFHAKRVMAEEDRHRKSYDAIAAAHARAGAASGAARAKRTNANKGEQPEEIEVDIKTETKEKPLFSYEKKRKARACAPEQKDNSWMNEYD